MRIPQALQNRQEYYALLGYSTPVKLVNLVLAEIQRVLRQPYLYAYPYKMIVDMRMFAICVVYIALPGRKSTDVPKGL